MAVNKNFHIKCFYCGSELVFVSRQIVQPEGMRFPQINTVYRCSNSKCQEKKDKEKKEREKLREKKEAIEKERAEKMQEKRRMLAAAKQ